MMSAKLYIPSTLNIDLERGYMVRTLASRPGVPGSNPIAAPKSYEVYPSTSGLLSFKKPETVLWTIAKHYYYYYYYYYY